MVAAGAGVGLAGAAMVDVVLYVMFPPGRRGDPSLDMIPVLALVGSLAGGALGVFSVGRSRNTLVVASIAACLASGPLTGACAGLVAGLLASSISQAWARFLSGVAAGSIGSVVLSPVLVLYGLLAGVMLDVVRTRIAKRAAAIFWPATDANSVAATFE